MAVRKLAKYLKKVIEGLENAVSISAIHRRDGLAAWIGQYWGNKKNLTRQEKRSSELFDRPEHTEDYLDVRHLSREI